VEESLGPLFIHPGELSEPVFWLLPVACAVAAAAICAVALIRGRLPETALSAGIVFLPLLAFALSNAILMERSKRTEFCGSCHVMAPVRESLQNDDGTLASFHVSHGAVPSTESCYTCHSGYGVWGGIDAKLAGVGHMLHTVRDSYDYPLAMNRPYNIDACLACHAEAKGFRAVDAHQMAEIQESLLAGEMGCAGTCHPAAHPAEALAAPAEVP
jgi:hypothetical protein